MSKQNRFLILAVAISLILAFGFTLSARAQTRTAAFEPAPCMFEGIDLGLTTLSGEALGFECGYVTVPERHAAPDGATIRLPVAIRKATNTQAQLDPLFVAQGGPGGDALRIYTLLLSNTQLAQDRDIVIFNQRGAPYAEPDLTCPETKAALGDVLAADTEEGERLTQDALAKCYDRLTTEGKDLSAFNSLENAADVPAIAQALGYDTYNFYGVSYGTLLGLYLMRYHPEGLRAVILDSVVPPDVNFVQRLSESEDRVYDELFAACEADDMCRAEYPNLEQRYFALIRKLDDEPITLALRNPDTGARSDAYIDGRNLRSVMYQLLYLPDMPAIFPKIVHDMERGDFRYIQAMLPLIVFDQDLADGMYYSIMCAESLDVDPAALPIESLRPEIGESAAEDIESFQRVCEGWRVEQLPEEVNEPVQSDVPVLLLSGNFDPITPPMYAEAAATGLTNAYRYVDPAGSHGVAFMDDCVNAIILSFLNDPASAPDGTCLTAPRQARTIPPNAITLPLLAGLNSLNNDTMLRGGLGVALLLVVLSPFVVWPVIYVVRAVRGRPFPGLQEDRRLRISSRVLLLVFGGVALVFTTGLLVFIIVAFAEPVYASAIALPPTAVVLVWLAAVLLLLAVGALAMTFMLWQQRGASSTGGRIYYTIVSIAAVAFVLLIGAEGLLRFPS